MTVNTIAPPRAVSKNVQRRGLFAGLGALALAGGGAPPPNEDSQMIVLCSHWSTARSAINNAGGISDKDPRWDTYSKLSDAISAWKPVTVEGLIALAKATDEEATHLDGDKELEVLSMEWAWGLIDGLIRLGGRA